MRAALICASKSWFSFFASLFGFVIWKILSAKQRNSDVPASPADPALAPAERIRSLGERATGDAKQKLYALSAAFREWLALYYRLEGSQEPEPRWIEKLKEKELSREEWQALRDLLSSLHEAKYGPEAEAKAPLLMRRVREFVDVRTPAGAQAAF